MTDIRTDDVHGRTLTAFFDSREAAQKATADLVEVGIPREQVRLTEGAGDTAGSASTTRNSHSFWDELKELFLPDEDRYSYAEGLRRGGYLLSVRSDEANYTRILDILDRDGSVDMDTREASWRETGWTGYQPGALDSGASSTSVVSEAPSPALSTSSVGSAGNIAEVAGATAPVGTLRDGQEDVLSVYEETANVAKRDVTLGRVRLRSYVVETPFTQQVNLRNEQVQVERRPVDRPIAASDAVFQDRVIEAEEHREEALISKEARVKEEIELRKTVENQSQTVSEKLRHTEVEVEDNRGGHAVAGLQSAAGQVDASRIAEHMPVIASDGTQVGVVDNLEGADRIKLTKNASPDGQHHFIPLSWVDHIDTHVHLNKAAAEVHASW